MMRRYRAEILVFFLTMVLCVLAIRVFGQDPPKDSTKPASATTKLKPGDEVQPTELESAKLGKLKAQLDRADAQVTILQQQYNSLQNERAQLQVKIETIVKDVQTRVRLERQLDVVYDQRSGENGTFRVNSPQAAPPLPAPLVETPAPSAKK